MSALSTCATRPELSTARSASPEETTEYGSSPVIALVTKEAVSPLTSTTAPIAKRDRVSAIASPVPARMTSRVSGAIASDETATAMLSHSADPAAIRASALSTVVLYSTI